MEKVTPWHVIIKLLNTSDEKLKSCAKKKTLYIKRNKERAAALDECLCPAPNSLLEPNPQCDGVRWWDLREVFRCEGGALMMGLLPF